jgi:hypothetical protein
MDRKTKVGVICIFSVGIICVVVAVARIITASIDASSYTQPAVPWLALWGLIEGGIGKQKPQHVHKPKCPFSTLLILNVAVVIGCLPAFYPYLRRKMQSYGQRTSYLQGRDLYETEMSNFHPIQRSKTTNSITGHHGQRPATPTPLNGISVVTDFEVRSSRSSHTRT